MLLASSPQSGKTSIRSHFLRLNLIIAAIITTPLLHIYLAATKRCTELRSEIIAVSLQLTFLTDLQGPLVGTLDGEGLGNCSWGG